MQSKLRLSGMVGMVAAIVTLAACHDGGPRRGLGAFAASPDAIIFGAVALGSEKVVELQLTNQGRVPFRVMSVTINVPNVSCDFEPVMLEAGETRAVPVRFAPQVEGDVQGVLTITTDEMPDPLQVPVAGKGVKAYAEVLTRVVDFGQVEIETSKVQQIYVRNPTGVETTVRFFLSGEVDQFSSAQADRDLLLAPGEQRAVAIAFKPIKLALSMARATFTVCSGCETQVVELQGEGIADKLDVSPTRLNFGRVSLGATATQTVTITNLGTEPVSVNGATLINDPAGQFSVDVTPKVLGQGEASTLTVSFAPKTPGVVTSAMLHIDAVAQNAPNGVTLGINAEGGVSCVSYLPKEVDFGTVPEGMSATRRVDVFNRCSYEVTLLEANVSTDVGGYFSLAQMSPVSVIPPGTVSSVKVTYTPKPGAPNSSGAITFKAQEKNAQSTDQVHLTGASKTFAPCVWQTVPGSLDFGAVPVGSEVTLGVSLLNAGIDTCFVGGLQLASGSDAAFTATPINSTLIEPGEVATLKVTFKPMAEASYSGMAEGWVNHPTNNHPTIPIQGTGVKGCFALQPTNVDYGMTKLSCGPKTRTVIAYNTCTAPVTLSSVRLDTPTTTDITLGAVPALPYTLAAGGQLSFDLTYAPSNDGDDVAALRVVADGLEYTAGLFGLGLTQPTRTDVFVQDSQSKVDVLFVIDNSGSMMEEQANLGQNFQAFLSAAQAQAVDYQIGVTTTGIDPSPGGWSVCPGGAEGGEAGRLFPVNGSSPRIIRPNTPNAAQVFANNVNVGWCHWNEQGLEAAYRALSPPLINNADAPGTSEPNDGNLGFLRADAKLAVVFLSDEDDYSTQPVSFYETFFKSLKTDPTQLSISAIVGPANLATCPTASSSGLRYIALANATGGVVESICTSDWQKALQNIGGNTFGLKRRFKLTEVPVGTPTVSVNGVDQTSGWQYDAATNSVVFDEKDTPAAGSVIEVTYSLGC
ncbi:MAG: choice-of-anchor D domain-containing protein [Myxococcaceae bacterium]|nr:choice-of-anchor D domain-containing protein [Myxococcaceae bacterium]